jgi:hypothetical protein
MKTENNVKRIIIKRKTSSEEFHHFLKLRQAFFASFSRLCGFRKNSSLGRVFFYHPSIHMDVETKGLFLASLQYIA